MPIDSDWVNVSSTETLSRLRLNLISSRWPSRARSRGSLRAATSPPPRPRPIPRGLPCFLALVSSSKASASSGAEAGSGPATGAAAQPFCSAPGPRPGSGAAGAAAGLAGGPAGVGAGRGLALAQGLGGVAGLPALLGALLLRGAPGGAAAEAGAHGLLLAGRRQNCWWRPALTLARRWAASVARAPGQRGRLRVAIPVEREAIFAGTAVGLAHIPRARPSAGRAGRGCWARCRKRHDPSAAASVPSTQSGGVPWFRYLRAACDRNRNSSIVSMRARWKVLPRAEQTPCASPSSCWFWAPRSSGATPGP